MKSKQLQLVALIFILVLISGCGGGGSDPEPSSKEWNFLVYLDGDNNLESMAINDINEMEQIGSNDRVNILVLVDRNAGYNSSNGDWASTRLYYITRDTQTDGVIRSQLLVDYGEKDMSDPNTLRDFITYCQTNYPASHTVLTLWDHGGGVWPRGIQLGNKGQKQSRGICWDDTTGSGAWDCLTSDEVALAFSQARTATGQKLDIIAMDSCLMQMLEVAYEWRNDADYLVGSEETVPGPGFYYTAILQELTTNTAVTARSFSITLVDEYYNYYNALPGENTTCSALSLGTEFNALMTAFQTFATTLYNKSDLSQIKTAWDVTDYYEYPENSDLYDFTQKLIANVDDDAIDAAATGLASAIDNAVLRHRETGSHAGGSFGLALLMPNGAMWASYSGANQYVQLEFAQDTNWDEFIVRFASTY